MATKVKKTAAPVVEVIRTDDVNAIKKLRRERALLEQDLETLVKNLKAREQAVIDALKRDIKPEPDCPMVVVDEESRLVPKWKDEAVLLAVATGKNEEVYVAEVRARTKPTIITRLVINGDKGHSAK